MNDEALPDDARLLVLYLRDTTQSWCMYGDHKEADSELKLIQNHEPGTIEKGRIWVLEHVTYLGMRA